MNKIILIIIMTVGVVLFGVGSYSYINRERIVTPPGLVVISPSENQEVASPFKITGYVNGDGWIGFEGQVGMAKLIVDGIVLQYVPLMAKDEWTKEGPINFEGNVEFQIVGNNTATLEFSNENPSGSPEKDKKFILPIILNGYQGEGTVVKVYFLDNNDSLTCRPSSSVDRVVPKTQALARAALEELLKGPTDLEKSKYFYTVINPGVKIQSLVIDDKGAAKVDFSQELESTGGSCRVAAIRAQITQTLKQFSSVKDVIISIDGRAEDILQP